MSLRSLAFRFSFALLILAIPVAVAAQPIGKPSGGGESYSWELTVSGHEAINLTIALPDGEVYSATYPSGKAVVFRLRDLPGEQVLDGQYTYELRVTPRIPPALQKQLAAARAAGDERATKKLLREAGLANPALQSGAFQVIGGSIVQTGVPEGDANDAGFKPSTNASRFTPVPNDQVIPDDLIVQMSLCVGFDCVDGESFGFDTIRLKENNLRIKFEDTSVAPYPTTDWQITANDSTSGGANKFSVEDITSTKVPFTIAGGAPTNTLYVDSIGNIGVGTATPVLDVHVNTSDTPAVRLEQNNSGGWTAQTWDIAGNESNFFIRDITGGSKLPFRIRPGAPTSSIDISGSGDVGIGIGSPEEKLHVVTDGTAIKTEFSSATSFTGFAFYQGDTEAALFNVLGSSFGGTTGSNGLQLFNSRSGALVLGTNNTERFRISATGNVGINCASPGAKLVVATTASTCATPSSSLNPGDAQFTTASSRTFKENLELVEVPDVLDRIEKVGVYNYDFIDGPKDRLGLMAEDFYAIFGRGDDKFINGNDVQMALWLAVKELSARNKELAESNKTLEQRLKALEEALGNQ